MSSGGGRSGSSTWAKRRLGEAVRVAERVPGQAGQAGGRPSHPAAAEAPARLPGLSTFLPAHDEAENLEAVVADLLRVLPEVAQAFEVIVVDDGSTDGTGALADGLARRDPRVRVVHHPRNLGYGAALRSGIAACRHPFIFFTDADRQFDVRELPGFATQRARGDIVVGYRHPRRDPWLRRVNGYLWTVLVRRLFGLRVRDVDCAFKLFPRAALAGLPLETTGATISTEILVLALRQGYRVVEVPVGHYARPAGRQSGARLGVILRAFRELWRLRRRLG
jgi:glycosyltransferase involved in cell wall biosynthesis